MGEAQYHEPSLTPVQTTFLAYSTFLGFFLPRCDGLAANQLFNATICIEITAKGPLGTVSGKETRMQITGIATSTYPSAKSRN